MTTTTNLSSLTINKMTRAQYEAATKDPTQLYLVEEVPGSSSIAGPVKVDGTTITSNNGTISAASMGGASASAAGSAGIVPAPAAGDQAKYLKGDGTWATVEAGPTVVQTTGTSTTDVMSQNAVTSMVYSSNNVDRIRIGNAGSSSSSIGIGGNINSNSEVKNGSICIGAQSRTGTAAEATAIGKNSYANYVDSTALGAYSYATANYSVAVGYGSVANSQGEFAIGGVELGTSGYNSSQYRLLTNVYDGQSAHDAATKGQLDSAIISGGTTAPTTATAGVVGQIYTYYDSTNSAPKVMMCTAVSGSTYTWTDILQSVANQLAQL